MILTTIYIDVWSSLSSTMVISINYKSTLFYKSNLTPIHGESTFKTLHNIRNKIKANAKSIYSNIGGEAHGHLGLVLTDAQYVLILSTPFVYLTHPGPIIILYRTTAHMNSNMPIVHTEEVRLFREVTEVEQALVQQGFLHSRRLILQIPAIKRLNQSKIPCTTFSHT